MRVCNSCSYLDYLERLVGEYNNIYHCSVGRKPIGTSYSALTKEIEMIPKAPKFKVGDEIKITKYKNIFSKVYTNNWSQKIFWVFEIVLRH